MNASAESAGSSAPQPSQLDRISKAMEGDRETSAVLDFLLAASDQKATEGGATATKRGEPADRAGLKLLLSRLLERLEGGRRDRILVKASGEILLLKAQEVDWIEAEGDYVKFHAGGRSYLMRGTMAGLESRLDPGIFIRIHRSTIVNADRLRKLSPSFKGEYAVVLQDGTKLRLSRGYQDRIRAVLGQLD